MPSEITPAPRESLTVTHVRSFGILAFRATILAGLTLDQKEFFLEKLGPESRKLMQRPPGAEEWVPVERLKEIRSVYAQHFKMNLERVRGYTMASLLFSQPVLEALQNNRNISPFLARFPQIWQACHKGGRVEATQLGPNRARISIQAQFPYPQYLDEVMPSAFLEALNLTGLTGGRVDHLAPTPDDPTHHYDLAWDL